MVERKSSSSLDDLDKRLEKARADAFERDGGDQGLSKSGGMGAGFHVATELVVAILVAVAIGWFLDDWLDTKPLFLVILFFFGAAAGALNVYRRAQTLIGGGGFGNHGKFSAKPSESRDDKGLNG